MDLGFSELLFILFLALLLFGPKRLPEIGRQIGKFVAEFKKAGNQFRAQLEEEVRQLDAEQQQVAAAKGELMEAKGSLAQDLASVTETLRDLRNMKSNLSREITNTIMAPSSGARPARPAPNSPPNTVAKGSLAAGADASTAAQPRAAVPHEPSEDEPNA